jgi:hypothetical protein
MNSTANDYVLAPIRKDEEFVLCRGRDPGRTDAPSVLLLSPVSKQPSLGTLEKLENEYSLKDERKFDGLMEQRLSAATCQRRPCLEG